MRVFKCDRCNTEFKEELDREVHNGKTYDLCAPCRKDLRDSKIKVERDFFKKING